MSPRLETVIPQSSGELTVQQLIEDLDSLISTNLQRLLQLVQHSDQSVAELHKFYCTSVQALIIDRRKLQEDANGCLVRLQFRNTHGTNNQNDKDNRG